MGMGAPHTEGNPRARSGDQGQPGAPREPRALPPHQSNFLLQGLKSCFLDSCPLVTGLLGGRWGGVGLREDDGSGSGVETTVNACSARQVDDSMAQPGQREKDG